ncbi:MAG: hypothetical protein Q9220_000142 [cf. Caloplaca sp. 1 TL-2023]
MGSQRQHLELDPNTSTILEQLQSIDQSTLPNDDVRIQILRAAQSLCHRLETPYEWIMRMTWQEDIINQPSFNFCLRIADDIKLFKAIGEVGGPPKTVAELASHTATDPALLARILRHLGAMGVVTESIGEQSSYLATEISAILATLEGSSTIRHCAQVYSPTFAHAPDYFKTVHYKEPKDARSCPFQHAMGQPNQSNFEWLGRPENKVAEDDFNNLMTYNTRHRKSWMDVFPPEPLLVDVKDSNAALFVDIGGGAGTDVMEFKRRYPNAPGRVILQELSSVIEMAKENTKGSMSQEIEYQVHDFFKQETVEGARIYFMGAVLHDWPNAEARQILRNVAPAMKKGYSKLLLSENVIITPNRYPHLSAIDLLMMMMFGSKERTEEELREMLMQEGLKLVAVHSIPSCYKSVLEVELA